MSESVEFLKTLMDVSSLRQRVLAGNLANVNTSGYTRKEVSFKKALSELIEDGKKGEYSEFKPEVVSDTTTPFASNGNNVKIQKELAAMTDNSLLYNVAARALTDKFARMKSAISGK